MAFTRRKCLSLSELIALGSPGCQCWQSALTSALDLLHTDNSALGRDRLSLGNTCVPADLRAHGCMTLCPRWINKWIVNERRGTFREFCITCVSCQGIRKKNKKIIHRRQILGSPLWTSSSEVQKFVHPDEEMQMVRLCVRSNVKASFSEWDTV